MRGQAVNKTNPNQKLLPEDVALIKALLEERRRHLEAVRLLSNAAIGSKFGVTESAIASIACGRTWRNQGAAA